jgi:ATP-dependent Lon protease
LAAKKNNFLDSHMLHITVENPEACQLMYCGSSGGVLMALMFLSECLQLEIPGHVAMTGQVTGHGKVFSVGGIREKLIAAKRLGKTVIYVPSENLVEALDYSLGVIIKPIESMHFLFEDIFGLASC